MVKIGIIGGSGVYDPKMFEDSEDIAINTPYGAPSDMITTGKFKGVDIVFIPRHGKNHTINPTNVNYKANIHAMKELGVTHILAPGTSGSLQEEIRPGDFVFSDQFIDRTTKRKSTFYDENQVCHIGISEATCPDLRKILSEKAEKLGLRYHKSGTNICMEGPRFSTRAESELYRSWKAKTINMTMVPECVLAREAEICYATIMMVTDYDVWRDSDVSIDVILKVMSENIEKVKKLISEVIPAIPDKRVCGCKDALKNALI